MKSNTMCDGCVRIGFVYLMDFDGGYYCLYCQDDRKRKGLR